MTSKHPQQVMGNSITLYSEHRSISPWLAFLTNRFTPSNSPFWALMSAPLSTGWFAPDGDISYAIFPSSQLIAPQSAGRSGVITQT